MTVSGVVGGRFSGDRRSLGVGGEKGGVLTGEHLAGAERIGKNGSAWVWCRWVKGQRDTAARILAGVLDALVGV